MDEKDDIVEVPKPDPPLSSGIPDPSAETSTPKPEAATPADGSPIEPAETDPVPQPHLYRLRAPGLKPVLRPRRHRSRLRNDCPPDARPPTRGSRGRARLR